MRQNKKIVKQLSFTIILLFIVILVIAPSSENDINEPPVPINNHKQDWSFLKDLNPRASTSTHNYNVYIMDNSSFSEDPRGTGTYQWTTSSYFGVIMDTFESDLDCVKFSFFDDGYHVNDQGYMTLNLNLVDLNLLGFKITNAQFNVTWEASFLGSGDVDWSYSKNGGPFLLMSETRRSSTFSKTTQSFSLSSLMLTGTETSVRLRLSVWMGKNYWVRFYGFQLGTFLSSMSDPTTQLNDQDLNISATVDRCGSESGLDTNEDHYRLYYKMNSLPVDASALQATRSSDFNGNLFTFNFTIPASQLTQKGTLYYRLRVANNTGTTFYWSPTYSIVIYSMTPPSLQNIQANATSSTLSYNNSLRISGNALDSSGTGLKRVDIIWGGSTGVTYETKQGNLSQSVSGSNAAFALIINRTWIIYNQALYYRVYAFNNLDLNSSSIEYSIIPTDLVQPVIHSNASNTWDVIFNVSKTLVFNVSDPMGGSGLNDSSVACYFNVNSNNFGTAQNLTDYTRTDNQWKYELGYSNYSGDARIYIWLYAADNKGNINSVYLSFHAIDIYAPSLSNIQTNATSLTLNYNYDLLITGDATDFSGSGLYRIELLWGYSAGISYSHFYGTNSMFISGNSVTFSLLISHFELNYAQTVYYRLFLYDKVYLNTSSIEYFITPTDLITPLILGDVSNSLGVVYNETKSLIFDITEPSDASGVKESTIASYFSLNVNDFASSYKIVDYSKNGNRWTYIADAGSYNCGARVYGWLFATDNKGNIGNITFSFNVIDIYPPEIIVIDNITETNVTLAQADANICITVQVSDGAGCGIMKVEMRIFAESSDTWEEAIHIYLAQNIGNDTYRITVPASDVKAGYMYYRIRVYDNAGLFTEIKRACSVSESSIPNTPNNQIMIIITLIMSSISIAIVGFITVRLALKKRKRASLNTDISDLLDL